MCYHPTNELLLFVVSAGEIRATAWKEVADRLYPQVEVGRTYLIARGQLKVANKKFSTLNNNYEITLTHDSQLQLCTDEPDAGRPKIHSPNSSP